jgi:nitrogen-specific signal transduction histidine kinase
MVSFFQPVFTILTTNPGNLAYHLVLAFSIAGALQSALIQVRHKNYPQARRLVLGLSLLLVIRLGLFVTAGLAWGQPSSIDFLPPVDRAASLFSLVLIVWLWSFPIRQRLGDAGTLLLGMLVATIFFISLIWWGDQGSEVIYNGSLPDIAGEFFSIVVILMGMLMIILRKFDGWGTALAMLGLLLVGHLAHLIAPLPEGDYAGAVRLSQMAAYPLLLLLAQRLPGRVTTNAGLNNIPAYMGDLNRQILGIFAPLPHGTPLEAIHRQVLEGMAKFMHADACLLVSFSPQQDFIKIKAGYDLSKGSTIKEKVINESSAPALMNFLRAGEVLLMPSELTSTELPDFAPALNLYYPPHVLATPVYGPSTEFDALILLSFDPDRGFTKADQDHLASMAELVSQIFEHTADDAFLNKELERVQADLAKVQTHFASMKIQKELLCSQLEEARHASVQEQSRSESLAAIVANHEIPEGVTIAQLQSEIKRLKESAGTEKTNSKEAEHLEAELRLALEEIAHLKKIIFETDKRNLELETRVSGTSPRDEKTEQITFISQELRQPMSSIVGYTDLLLGESIGILGALQRKFLERIRASTERMGILVDDLLEKVVAENGGENGQQSVDLSPVIDEAIALSMSQLREKNIALRVDLPQELPGISADRESLQQILLHLLQNAGSATPIEGQVGLHASLTKENTHQEYILLQVTDSGEGILPEDLPRVFSRLYRAGNNPIQGVGDTGIGLAVAKALVEAQKGRIWIDTFLGRGSTISVLLPVTTEPVSKFERGQLE